jgi:redox-sensitive bicupin YhaK (pirin superfamily)
MLSIRRGAERGHADLGWLSSYHTFSFADYYDPAQMGYRSLRVLNQDRVAGGHGFPLHPHRDMEIISYVLQGALEHEDTMGHRAVLRPGEVQVISAGTGMAHGETNPSPDQPVHFLQMWVVPNRRGVSPRYQQQAFPELKRRSHPSPGHSLALPRDWSPQPGRGPREGRLRLVASGDGRDGSLPLNQDADVYVTLLGAGETATLPLHSGRGAYVHVARGTLTLNGQRLAAGDGAAVSDEATLTLTGEPDGAPDGAPDGVAEAVLFDLA